MSASTDLTFALTHAIAFLTRSLVGRYTATTIDLLHFTLERNLTKLYENNWFPNDPQRGAGRRCLTLVPGAAPPRPIYFACKSARVNWTDWMSCLGNVETDVFIDPGCVSVRFGAIPKSYVVWSAVPEKRAPASSLSSTIAQSILRAEAEDEDDENELFNMIADEIRAPTWKTPVHAQFPNLPAPGSRRSSLAELPKLVIPTQPRLSKPSYTDSALLSVGSGHSRSSSHSSLSDASGFSFSSVDSASTTATSLWTPASSKRASPASSRASPKSSVVKNTRFLLPAAALVMQAPEMEDDEDADADANALDAIALTVTTPMGTHHATAAARAPRVLVDATKKEVTPYDGGKTTVLTGGVMLGMKSQTPAAPALINTTRFALAQLPGRQCQSNWRGALAAGPLRA